MLGAGRAGTGPPRWAGGRGGGQLGERGHNRHALCYTSMPLRARSPAAIYTYSRTTDDLRLQASSRCPRRLERGASLLADAFTSPALASRRPRSASQGPVVPCLLPIPLRPLPTCRGTSLISRTCNAAPTPSCTGTPVGAGRSGTGPCRYGGWPAGKPDSGWSRVKARREQQLCRS